MCEEALWKYTSLYAKIYIYVVYLYLYLYLYVSIYMVYGNTLHLAVSKAPRSHWSLNEKFGTRPGMHSYKLFIREASESPKNNKRYCHCSWLYPPPISNEYIINNYS